MKFGSRIINIGVDGLSEKNAKNIQTLNLLSLIAISVSTLYLIFYFSLNTILPGLINIFAILLYTTTFVWVFKKRDRLAKTWIFSVHMIHLLILVLFVFSKEAGFQFYSLIIPFLVFLVFDYQDTSHKLILSIFAIFLFFICETVDFQIQYIHLSQEINRILYFTSILTAFLGALFVVYLFTSNIKKYEEKQHRLVQDLQSALSEVKTLKGFLPICSSCKKIRDDKGYWNQIESYIQEYSDAQFSHGMCPECSDKLYGKEDWYIEMKKEEQ